MHLFFALISAAACGCLGVLFSRRAAERYRLARAWEAALERMESAVLAGESLQRILLTGSGGQIPLLGSAAETLRRQPALTVEAWLAALPREPLLQQEEYDLLAACLRGLFSPHMESQMRALRFCRERWQAVVRRCGEESEKNGRLYGRLGWLGGAALFILMC